MTRLTARMLVAVACGLTLVGVPGAALGSVVPNACIAGVGLWDSKERVAREWGLPTRVTPQGPDIVWHYPKRTVVLYRWRERPKPDRWIVLVVSTTNPRDRLRGIGVGSWRSEVHAAIAKAGGGCPKGSSSCELAHTFRGGERVTTVSLTRNRVTELSVSVYSDFDDGPLQYADKRCRPSRP